MSVISTSLRLIRWRRRSSGPTKIGRLTVQGTFIDVLGSSSRESHCRTHLRHRARRDGAGAGVAGLEGGAGVAGLEGGAPGAERLELRLHVLDHDLLALETADARGTAPLLLAA